MKIWEADHDFLYLHSGYTICNVTQMSFRFRVLCYNLSASSPFGNLILVCIMFSSAMLACEDPLDAQQKGFRNWVSSLTKHVSHDCYLHTPSIAESETVSVSSWSQFESISSRDVGSSATVTSLLELVYQLGSLTAISRYPTTH